MSGLQPQHLGESKLTVLTGKFKKDSSEQTGKKKVLVQPFKALSAHARILVSQKSHMNGSDNNSTCKLTPHGTQQCKSDIAKHCLSCSMSEGLSKSHLVI
eukprot:s1553_g19.t1